MKNNLIVFMGYPGCGKTYLSKQLITQETDLYLSSDDLRVEMFGFRDQTHNEELFNELYRRVEEHVDVGDVYIDATNLSRKDRARILTRFKKLFKTKLICVLRSLDELVETNNQRKGEEHIPESIFKRILGKWQLPTHDEGWDEIEFYYNTTKFSPLESFVDFYKLEDEPHDNPYHPETIKQHINYLIDYCVKNNKGDFYKHIALYHDLGKFYVKDYREEKGYCQFIGHQNVSAYIYLVNHVVTSMYSYNKPCGFVTDIVRDLFRNEYMFTESYLTIVYHDMLFDIKDRDSLIKALRKADKPVKYLYKVYRGEINTNIEKLADCLIEFNKIDKLREGDFNV